MFDHLSWNEQLIQKDSEIMKRMQVGSWVAHSQWAIHLFLSQACIESLLSSITRATTSGAKVWLFVWNQVGEWTLLMTMVQDDSCLFRSGCCPSDIRWESRNIPCYQGEGHTEQQWDDMWGEGHIEWQWDHMLGVHQGCVLPIHFVTMITWIWCLLCVSLFCYIAPVCFGCDFRKKQHQADQGWFLISVVALCIIWMGYCIKVLCWLGLHSFLCAQDEWRIVTTMGLFLLNSFGRWIGSAQAVYHHFFVCTI